MSELFKIYVAIKTFFLGKKGLEEGFSPNWTGIIILLLVVILITIVTSWYSNKKAKKQREKWNLKK